MFITIKLQFFFLKNKIFFCFNMQKEKKKILNLLRGNMVSRKNISLTLILRSNKWKKESNETWKIALHIYIYSKE